ncbi:hypothetical protein C8P68_1031 [Mucilaginibacter yixingensis]|uniref:Uncharacterized protein n=1 Tax=Mucilaginibacter yixingensis TaxID=1295612 RepID=A0A2T5JAE4_9SPHI|nr:hypothetical protein [Mucilaginibacter yixingensis]PTQ97843.1 hypothetical protein C8P68_1031 [Mucilaginibacter yixingensis]
MDKLIRFLIGTAVALVVMYIIGIIVSLILIGIISVVLKITDKYRPEWSDWEFDRAMSPLVTKINGQEFFQERTVVVRSNRKTGEVQTKMITSPNQKPVSEASRLEDLIFFANRCSRLV